MSENKCELIRSIVILYGFYWTEERLVLVTAVKIF